MHDDPRIVGPRWQAPPAAPPPPTIDLHPNLARIAFRYQDVAGRYARGELDPATANREIQELVARDDQGLAWTINPADGGWLYWSRAGNWVAGNPPTSGLAGLSPHDLTNPGDITNPDHSLTMRKVDDNGTSLVGSTRRKAKSLRPVQRPRWVYPAIAVVAVLVVIFVLLAFVDGGGANEPPLMPLPTMPQGR